MPRALTWLKLKQQTFAIVAIICTRGSKNGCFVPRHFAGHYSGLSRSKNGSIPCSMADLRRFGSHRGAVSCAIDGPIAGMEQVHKNRKSSGASAMNDPDDLPEQLSKFAKLHADGVLTDDEFTHPRISARNLTQVRENTPYP
jgi:hypothetical protein